MPIQSCPNKPSGFMFSLGFCVARSFTQMVTFPYTDQIGYVIINDL